MSELAGQVAVVTGAAQGIGRSVAEAFSMNGAAVAVVDVSGEAAERTAQELSAPGRPVIGLAADVSSETDIERVGGEVEERLGPVSVWVNNAGITRPAMLTDMAYEDFEAVVAVHAGGTFLGLREAARRMRAKSTRGSIVNVTSSAGLQGTIGQINYAAAKGAITAMTKSAAKELARHGIRVNAVAPLAATPMTETIRTDAKLAGRYLAQVPMGRFAEPDEIADAFLFLASERAGYVTGQVLCIDGGLYMAS